MLSREWSSVLPLCGSGAMAGVTVGVVAPAVVAPVSNCGTTVPALINPSFEDNTPPSDCMNLVYGDPGYQAFNFIRKTSDWNALYVGWHRYYAAYNVDKQLEQWWDTPAPILNGSRFVEMNYYNPGAAYRGIPTTPAQMMTWILNHRAGAGFGTQSMEVRIGSAVESPDITQWATNTTCRASFTATSASAWDTHSDAYTVPSGRRPGDGAHWWTPVSRAWSSGSDRRHAVYKRSAHVASAALKCAVFGCNTNASGAAATPKSMFVVTRDAPGTCAALDPSAGLSGSYAPQPLVPRASHASQMFARATGESVNTMSKAVRTPLKSSGRPRSHARRTRRFPLPGPTASSGIRNVRIRASTSLEER